MILRSPLGIVVDRAGRRKPFIMLRLAEAAVMSYIRSADFSVEGFMQRRSPKH